MSRGLCLMVMLLTLTSCKAFQVSLTREKPEIYPKFGEKFKTVHETITITKPGVYDYEGTTHVWKGEGGCDFLGSRPAIMEIYADNVTVKNFGFEGAIYGIRIVDEGKVRENVTLENVEGYACFRALGLPESYRGLQFKNVSAAVWREGE